MPDKTRFPLSWPTGWPRTEAKAKKNSTFSHARRDITISAALDRLEQELDRLGATEAMLSSNLKVSIAGRPFSGQAEPADNGVAVYFKLTPRVPSGHAGPRPAPREHVLACDRFYAIAGNIAAMAAHIEALRRIDRYGVGSVEQAFTGYQALAAPNEANRPRWRAVLDFKMDDHITPDIVRARHRAMLKALYSTANAGEDDKLRTARTVELNVAREDAMVELGQPRNA